MLIFYSWKDNKYVEIGGPEQNFKFRSKSSLFQLQSNSGIVNYDKYAKLKTAQS